MSALDAAFLRVPIAHRALHDVAAGRPENSRAAIEHYTQLKSVYVATGPVDSPY